MRHTRSRRKWKRRQQGDQEASTLQHLSGPLPDNVDQVTEPGDVKVASPKNSGDGPTPPEIIDLTIKEESPPSTPILPAQVLGSNEGVPGLKAGWVRFVVFRSLGLSDKKLGLVPAFEHHIALHRQQEVVFNHRRGN